MQYAQSPDFPDGGNVVRLRRAETALAESETRLRRSQELGGAHPYEWDLATHTILTRPGFARLYGLAANEPVTYEVLVARIHPDDRERVKAAHQRAIREAGPYEQEYRVVLPEGGERWVLARGEVVHDDEGQPKALAGIVLDITRRKQAEIALEQREAELAASERRFRALADAMPQMVWSTQPDGYHDYYNHRWYEFTGMPEGSTDGEEWNGVFHPDDQERAWARWRHSLATGDPYEIEYRLRHASGAYRWVLGRALPVRDEGGRIERWFGTCTDIHDLKQTEQALAESEEFTRRLLASSGDCIKVLDLDAKLRFMSEGGRRVMEVGDFCTVEGCHWPDFWTGPTAEAARQAVGTAKAGGTGRFEGFCPTVAGTPKWWDVVVTAILGPDGRPERLLSISRDITERKRSEEALAAERARLRAIFETVPVGILMAEAPSGQIVGGNPQLERILRHPVLPSPDVEGYKEWVAFHPDGRQVQGHEYPLSRAIRSGETTPGEEYLYQRGDGTRAWIKVSGAPIRDEGGRVTGGVVAVVDIDEQKRREADLREREALLGSIVQSEGLFTCVTELLDDDLRFVMASDRTAEFFGRTPGQMQGATLSGLGLGPEEVEHWVAFARECLAEGQATTLEYSFRYGERSIQCLGTFTPLPGELSERPRLSLVSLDITERKRLEESQALVSRELHHRVKNSLATVQAVVHATARHAETVVGFRDAVTDRIASLAQTHTLLINNEWGGAGLGEILRSELEPYDDGSGNRVRLSGPDLHVSSEIALALGMAVHELTTNAAKYGALSSPTGLVQVAWTVERAEGGQRLTLNWEEQGGPPVTAPSRKGFGSTLLQRTIERQLGGEVETTFAPAGLRVRMSAPLPDAAQH